ncbi:MAG: protease inhibitor I42 family protein [Methylococcales bacterium]|nr:protease inhibitor I42 family protein [Methylococcales bacterium]
MSIQRRGSTLTAGNTILLNENDADKTIDLHVDDELDLMLPAKPSTTGYVWELIAFDTAVLVQDGTCFIASDKAIGAGGIDIIKFHTIATGKSEVKLICHKPFECGVPPLKTFTVTIISRSD